jgi:predicted CXXCH cytochrome family protein
MNDQTNINHMRSTIAGSIVPGSDIVFTTRTMTGSFADGPPYNENVCNTCHSATNHHQSDGVIDPPNTGPQDHENGSDCTTCHDHNGPLNAFAAPVILVSAPHDAVTDCYACHMGNFADAIPNNKCEQCHTAGGVLKGSYPTAPDVATHAGSSYGPFTRDCVDCHNPMDPQTNQKHVRTDIVLAGGGVNVVYPPFVVGAAPWNGVCETCHTQTNHHQNDGIIDPPNTGTQAHNNAATCTDCHPHLDGFLPTGSNVPMPHDAQLCNTCHVAEPDYAAVIPDSACLMCHDELASPSGNLYQVDNFVGLTTGAAGRPIFGNWTGVAGSDGTNGWMVWTGPTNSAGTGPSAGNPVEYVVLESSASSGGADADPTNGVNVTAGSALYLVSNVIDASMYAVRFAFDWNMNVGNNTDASLHLDAWNGTAWDLDVTGGPINIGNNGDIWVTEGPIDLSAYSNVDFQLRIRYIVGTGTTYQNDVAVDNLVVLGAGGGAGSDLKVMTHADTVNPPRPYTYSNTCVGCHNPMYPQQNLAFIRQTIAGSILGGTIDFTAYMGAGSFADGPPYPDNICNTCHSNTQHHQADGIAPGGQDHNNGQDCGQCHPHLEGFQPQGGCTVCHSQSPPIGSSDPNRRQIVQNAGDGQGDFVKTSHHVTDGTTTEIVTDGSCIVCHDQSNHQSFGDGQSVLLNDQDGGASYTYDGTGASIEGFCVSCHDTDGSLLNGSQPFIVSGDINSPPDVGWSAGVVSHSTFDVCFNCHAQGHGSDFEKILAEDNEPGLCFNCHDADGPASTDISSKFAQQFGHPVTAANSSMQCLECHNPHQAEPGTHTPDGQWYPSAPDANTNLVSGVLSGVMGVEPSPWAPEWTLTDSYTVLDSAEKEYQICFKCHARYSHQYSQDCFMCHPMTWDPDLGAIVAGFKFRSAQREFNINNKSAHSVVVTSNNQSGSYAPKALSTSQMEAPWTNTGNQTMYCSDCHGAENEDGGDPRGPHGSDKPFMLKGPNTMWPAGSVRLFSLNDVSNDNSAQESLNTNWRNELFCLNCHDSFPTSNRNTWQNEVHREHDDRDYEPAGGNKRNVYCIACHAIVPHGSHVSRLITYRSELTEYNTYNDVNYNVIEGFRKTSRFSYSEDDCRTVTNLGCDKHDDKVNTWD